MIIGGNKNRNNIDPDTFDRMIQELRWVAMKYNVSIITVTHPRPLSNRLRGKVFERADIIFLDYH